MRISLRLLQLRLQLEKSFLEVRIVGVQMLGDLLKLLFVLQKCISNTAFTLRIRLKILLQTCRFGYNIGRYRFHVLRYRFRVLNHKPDLVTKLRCGRRLRELNDELIKCLQADDELFHHSAGSESTSAGAGTQREKEAPR